MLQLFVAFNVILYFSNVYLYFWWLGYSPIKPLHWYLFTIVGSACFLLLRRGPVLPEGLARRVLLWTIAFLALYAFSFVFVSDAGAEAVQAFVTSTESLVLLVAFLLLLKDPVVHRTATRALTLVVVVGVFINYFDFLTRDSIFRLSLVPGRAAGMYFDANTCGYVLVFGMLLSAWIIPRRLRWWYCLFVGTGVLLTFSRSSIMMWALGVISMAWAGWYSLNRRASMGLAILIVSVGAVALNTGLMADLAIRTGAGRYLDQNTLPRIATSFASQDDDSTRDRLRVAQRGLNAFLDAPVLGHGIGALNTPELWTETHNQYLVIAAELGLMGLILFLGVLFLLWYHGTVVSRMLAISYGFGCLFLHVLLFMPSMPIALAFAASYREPPRLGRESDEPAGRSFAATAA